MSNDIMVQYLGIALFAVYVIHLIMDRVTHRFQISTRELSLKARNHSDLKIMLELAARLHNMEHHQNDGEERENVIMLHGADFDRWLVNEFTSLGARTAKFQDMIYEAGLQGRTIEQPYADQIRKLIAEVKDMEESAFYSVQTSLRVSKETK